MSTHVFLTRFNLPANRIERSIFSDEWLTERVGLFERFTVPSVRSQSGSVRWIVYLDHASPAWLVELMDGYEAEGLLTPCYLDDPLSPERIRADIRAAVGPDETRVVTSNLDNDDGLAPDFTSRLATLAAEATSLPTALYLTTGIIRHGTQAYVIEDRDNAFSAVVDDVTKPDLATTWDGWHNLLHERMPVLRSEGAPAWLQVVHGRNVSNRVRGRLTDPARHRSTFPGLLDDLPAPTRGALLRDSVAGPVRAGAGSVRRRAVRLAHRTLGTERFERAKMVVQRRR